MNSLLIIIATATIGSALPVPSPTAIRYASPGEIDWYEDGSEDFVASVQLGNDDDDDDDEWEATRWGSAGPEVLVALFEDAPEWLPQAAGGAELLVGAASGARGFGARQAAWRRGVRAYDPHHWNRLPRAHRAPHAAGHTYEEIRTPPDATANPAGGAAE